MLPVLIGLGIVAAVILGWDDDADKPAKSRNKDKPKTAEDTDEPAEPTKRKSKPADPADDKPPKE
jgi:hypothetical protein